MIEKSLYDIKIDQHRFQIPLGPVEGSITAVIPTCGKSKLLDQCLDSLDDETKARHFAGENDDGLPLAWVNGCTSHTTGITAVWSHAELAEDGE